MASGQSSIPHVIGTILGAAAKELVFSKPPTNAGYYEPEDRSRNGHQNFKKNTKQFYPRSDVNSKKVAKTLEKLVDAKEDALAQEKIRRQKAELELMELQLKLKKAQISDNRKEQVNSTVKKDPSSGKNKPHYRPDGTRGGGHGGYIKSGRGGCNTSSRTNNKSYGESGQPGPHKLNNSNNINLEHGGYNKVYNKQPFPGCTTLQGGPANFQAHQSNFPNQIHGGQKRGGPHGVHYRTQKQKNSGPKNFETGK